jgi:hypothetical protein
MQSVENDEKRKLYAVSEKKNLCNYSACSSTVPVHINWKEPRGGQIAKPLTASYYCTVQSEIPCE